MTHNNLPILVVTGGNGRVARLLLPALSQSYRVHIIDRTPSSLPASAEWVTIGELDDAELMRTVFRGANAVLHLAANPSPLAPWPAAIGNATTTRAVLLAAKDAGVTHTVVASSVHAAGGSYRFGQMPTSPIDAPRPCCEYGVGKAASEALARLHFDSTGTSVRILRLGLTGWEPEKSGFAKTWLGDADATALVLAALTAPPGFGTYYGVSRFASQFWNVLNAERELGWKPQQELPVNAETLPPEPEGPCSLFAPRPEAGPRDL